MKIDWKKWLLITIGTISWSLTMIKSGWIYSYGMGFWGANGHDGVWHVALAESLSRGSLDIPVFTRHVLQNYHIGFDLFLAFIHKITFIPIVNLYFQILPLLFAALIGLLTYMFTLNWTKSNRSAWWSTFFVYFGGNFGWILGKGESAFWSTQAISTLINPPFALSLIFILLGLISLQKNRKLLAILFFGLLIQIKSYAGILVLGALLVSGNISVFFGSFLISIVIFLPLFKSSSNLLVWQPFWFLETLMGPDRLNWQRFYSAMTTYRMGGVWLKGIPAYLVAFAFFWIGNMGTRLLLIFRKIKIDSINIFIYSIISAGIIIPMFFLQKGTPWNTIQFFYYSLFFSSVLAGIALSGINRYLLIVVVLLTIPTTIITLKDVYIPTRSPAMLPNDELSALSFLSRKSGGIVLTYPFDSIKAKEAEANPPRPLYLYTSTAYVSAFSAHNTFLEDEINLDITGYDWKDRRIEVEKWYKEKDQTKARQFLKENNIKYIYWVKPQRALLGEDQLGLIKIFENKEVNIYVVKSEI